MIVGTLIELFNERQFARAPFGLDKAEAMIRRLRITTLFDGLRGDAPRDMRAAAMALADFSTACTPLSM